MICENALKELFYMQQVYATLFSVSNKIQSAGDKTLGNLSSKQYMAILSILHLPEHQANLNNIAKKLGTSKQNVRQIINVLEKKGYVEVLPSQNDKRAVDIQVTESGQREMAKSADFGIVFMADLFHEFTEDELQVFWGLLKKLYRFDGQEPDGFEAEPSIDHNLSEEEARNLLQQFTIRRNLK